MTQEINRQDLIFQLRAAFGFRGATAFELGESVLPVAVVEDCSRAPFHRKVGGVGASSVAAVAAQFSTVGVTIPAGAASNLRVVVRQIDMSCGGAIQLPVKIAVGAFPGIVLATNQNGSWDSIVGPPQAQAGGVNLVGAVVAPGSSFFTTAAPQANGGIPKSIERDWVIAPGFQLVCEATVANVLLQGAFYWEEYLLG